MTDTKKEMLQLYSKQDASGKELIFNMLLCAVVCGEPFYKEMQELLEQGNKQAMREALQRWTETAKAKERSVHNGATETGVYSSYIRSAGRERGHRAT